MADVATQPEQQDQKVPGAASSDTPQVGTPLGPPPVPRSATPQPSQKVSDVIPIYRASKVSVSCLDTWGLPAHNPYLNSASNSRSTTAPTLLLSISTTKENI
jgi:hypothetical protein